MPESDFSPETKPPVELVMRGLHQPKADKGVIRREAADPLEALDALLAIKDFPQPEPVIEWSDRAALCLVDVDWHGEEKPGEFMLERAVSHLAPAPARWWISHGTGLKLAYAARWPLDADELAALAMLMLRRECICPHWTGIEMATRTRHPCYLRGTDRAGGSPPKLVRSRRQRGSPGAAWECPRRRGLLGRAGSRGRVA
jgi:hypothetical protein